MPLYRITMTIQIQDDIEANSPEEAFQTLKENTTSSGTYCGGIYKYAELDENGVPYD